MMMMIMIMMIINNNDGYDDDHMSFFPWFICFHQGYATEILLTLENAIDKLAQELVFVDLRERSKSGCARKSEFRKSTSNLIFSMGAGGNFEGIRPNGPSAVAAVGNNGAGNFDFWPVIFSFRVLCHLCHHGNMRSMVPLGGHYRQVSLYMNWSIILKALLVPI